MSSMSTTTAPGPTLPGQTGVLGRLTAHPRVREASVVALLVIALELIIFRGYFSGSTIPEFDFMSGYNTEAYAWWNDGSFLAPTQWMPYLWGGYPSVSNLQNSSFYLPVGFASLFGGFTLHVSAALSALHVGAGAVGLYVFARRWGASIAVSLVGLSVWFFAAGFFSNATQPDIARAYAWLPWVMLVTSVKWPWHRLFGPPLALLILWQALLGIYPGMIVALIYTLPVWVVANQLIQRPRLRQYLVPLVIVGGAAALMTLLRFLPALIERGGAVMTTGDQSGLNLATIGTLLYPYNNPAIASYEVMRSFFLPAIVLPLVIFGPVRSGLARALIAITVVAVAFGVPNWPWHDALSNLPGMGLSRFRLSDFKFVMLFGLAMLALLGLDRLWRAGWTKAEGSERSQTGTFRWVALGALVLLNAGMAVIGIHYDFELWASLPPWLLLAATSVYAWFLYCSEHPLRGRALTVSTAVLLVAVTVSGTIWAFAVPESWRSDRPVSEQNYFQGSVRSFIDNAQPNATVAQRPARTAIPDPIGGLDDIQWRFGSAFYSNTSAVLGYVNLRGTHTYDVQKHWLYTGDEQASHLAAFWDAPGVVIASPPDSVPLPLVLAQCSVTGDCGGGLTVKPVSYDRTGSFRYDVKATQTAPVSLNEAWYSGWKATLCTVAGTDCRVIPTAMGKFGQITLTLPKVDAQLHLDYRLPGLSLAWVLFAVGILATALLVAIMAIAGARTRRRNRVELPS